MAAFLLNIVLAFVWAALAGRFTTGSFLAGFVLGYLILAITPRTLTSSKYTAKLVVVMRFLRFFAWEMIVANLRVAYHVITPLRRMRPGIVAVPLDVHTDGEITILANLMSLTPGTLSLDVSADRKVLYVHAMDVVSAEKLREAIKHGFERRLLEVLR